MKLPDASYLGCTREDRRSVTWRDTIWSMAEADSLSARRPHGAVSWPRFIDGRGLTLIWRFSDGSLTVLSPELATCLGRAAVPKRPRRGYACALGRRRHAPRGGGRATTRSECLGSEMRTRLGRGIAVGLLIAVPLWWAVFVGLRAAWHWLMPTTPPACTTPADPSRLQTHTSPAPHAAPRQAADPACLPGSAPR